MHLSLINFLTLGLATTALGAYSTKSTQTCSTYYGTKSIKSVPSQTKTKRASITVKRVRTINPVKTLSPKPVTRTVSRYASITVTSTAPQKTDVFTTTTAFYTVSIDTVTSTTVSTVFTQTEVTLPYLTTTTTIGTRSDFLPIQSDYANYPPEETTEPTTTYEDVPTTDGYDYTTGTDNYGDATETYGYETDTSYSPPTDLPRIFARAPPSRFPTSILCTQNITAYTTISSTTTARTTSTKTLPTRTISATFTFTRTARVTSNPRRASSTTTFSTTYTAAGIDVILSTSTSTTTLTREAPGATVTSYAACSADNFLSSYDNLRILGGFPATNYNPVYVVLDEPYTDATSCCERCHSYGNCAGFYSGYGSYAGIQDQCVILISTMCRAAEVLFEFYAPRNGGDVDFGYVVGNGRCGRVQYDGGIHE